MRGFRTAWISMALLVLVGFGGCDADPMPSPGIVNQLKLILSTSHVTRPGGPLDLIGIIGLKAAAPGSGFVVVRSPFSESVSAVTADGTFADLLPGAAGDQLTVTFKETSTGPESAPVQLTVPQPRTAAGAAASPSTPDTNPGDMNTAATSIAASKPDGQGQSDVTGHGLVAGQNAIVGNTRTGEVLEVMVSSTGTIDVLITAAVNDSIVVIVQDPNTGLTSGSASFSVPAL
jgi:hypothetical protein